MRHAGSNAIDLIDFFVSGWPYAKQSFRYRKNGNHHLNQNLLNWQDTIGWTAKEHYKGELITQQIAVLLDFNVKRNDADIDNLTKAVLDGLQGVIFKNDRQVVNLLATKRRQEIIGVRIRICTVKSFQTIISRS